ncbi:MAG: AAA family ATPase [Halobellus sp.]|uniref:AAA family ATPase n=1 Tax=Halobellus sp. TaxID=1979212 RepID=UPI0035D435B0
MGFFSDSDTERAKKLLTQARDDPTAIRDEADTLAELLGSEDREARRAATAALASLAKASPGAIEPAFRPLVDGLTADDEVVRQNAAVTVTQVATEYPGAAADTAVGPLVQCTVAERGGHPQAAVALKAIANERPDALRPAVDGLRPSLSSDDATIRERVTAIFAEVAAEEPDAVEQSLDELTARLTDERAAVREHAAGAISRVAEERPTAVSDAVGPLTRRLSDTAAVARPALKAVHRVAAADGDAVRPAVPELEPLLASDDPDVRRDAAAALLHVAEADERAVRPILSSVEPLLDDDDTHCRALATGIYGFVSREAPRLAVPVAETMADALDRDHDQTRQVAAAVLGRVATTKPAAVRPAFDALIDCLDDEDDSVRESVAGAVSRVAQAHPEAAGARSAALVARLDAGEATARLHAIRALRYAAMEDGDWIDTEAVRGLEPRLADDETDVRGEAAMAMTAFAIEAPGLVPDRQVRRLPELLRTAAGMSDDMVAESTDRLETATGVEIDTDAGAPRGADADRRETAGTDGDTAREPLDRAVTVEEAGVVVEKEVDTESFSRRAVRLLVANRSGRAVTVRVVDTPPGGVAPSAVGFHSDYHPDGWTIHEDHGLMEFEQRLDAGATVETVYGSPSDAPHDTDGEPEPPTVRVDTDAVRNDSAAGNSTDHVPPQPAAPAADVEGVAPPPERDLTDVAGMTDVKQRLQEEVLVPLADDRYEEYGFDGVTNILLHGPPGTGKTYLAEALAGHLGYNYVAATAVDIASDVVGQAASNVDDLFERARAASPSVLFIDEIDSVAADRSGTGGMTTSEQQMVTQLLTEIEALNESDEPVLLVAATNRIEAVDDAIERPGRFDARISVRKPDGEDRLEILQYHLEGVPVDWDGVDEDALVTATEGFAASHLAEVADAAGRTAVRETPEGEEPTVTAARLHRRYEADAPTLEVGEEADNSLHKPRYDGSLAPNH